MSSFLVNLRAKLTKLLSSKPKIRAQYWDAQKFEQEIIQEKKSAIIMFGAGWCTACKMQKPLMDILANIIKETPLSSVLVDTDQEASLTRSFAISKLPTLVVFKDGVHISTAPGIHSVSQLKQIADFLLQELPSQER